MPTLASIQGAPDPKDIVFLDGWQEKINRLREFGDPYQREACLVDLVLFLKETGGGSEAISFLHLRPHLVNKMEAFPRGEKLNFLKKILSQVDGYLVEDLEKTLFDTRKLENRCRILVGFRLFVEEAENNGELKNALNKLERDYFEELFNIVDKPLAFTGKKLSEAEHDKLVDFFRSQVALGRVLSEKDLMGIAIQIKDGLFPLFQDSPLEDLLTDDLRKCFMDFLKTPEAKAEIFKMLVGSSGSGMALRLTEDGKSIETFRPTGSIVIKAILSRSFTMNLKAPGWIPIPLAGCINSRYFASKGNCILIPCDGVWDVRGSLLYDSGSSVGRLCMCIAKNGVPLVERSVDCAREGRQAIDIFSIVMLKRDDTLTICSQDPLSGKKPADISSAELTVIFLGERFN